MVANQRLLRLIALVFGLALVGYGLAGGDSRIEGLAHLEDGNRRFILGKAENPRTDVARRVSTFKNGQKPLATILSCSDSRAPVERIFDQGIGDLFVIRVAGNIAGISEMATIEYGVEHLETPLLVVMGHKGCGAVAATVAGAEVHGNLPKLIEKIKPAVESVKARRSELEGPQLVAAAVSANVFQSMADLLRGSAIVRARVQKQQLTMIGAVYDLESGMVEWLGPHPEQESMLMAGNGIEEKEHKSAGGH